MTPPSLPSLSILSLRSPEDRAKGRKAPRGWAEVTPRLKSAGAGCSSLYASIFSVFFFLSALLPSQTASVQHSEEQSPGLAASSGLCHGQRAGQGCGRARRIPFPLPPPSPPAWPQAPACCQGSGDTAAAEIRISCSSSRWRVAVNRDDTGTSDSRQAQFPPLVQDTRGTADPPVPSQGIVSLPITGSCGTCCLHRDYLSPPAMPI